MLTTLWAKFEAWIIGIFAVLAAIGVAILYGREKGKAAEKQVVDVAQAQQQVNTATAIVNRTEISQHVDQEVASLPQNTVAPVGTTPAGVSPDPVPGSSADVLRNEFSRD